MHVRFFALLAAGALLMLATQLTLGQRIVALAADRVEIATGNRSWDNDPAAATDPQATPTPSGAGRQLSAGPVVGLICAFVASTLALGVAVGVRRRIDKVAGPPPDEEDD